MNVILLWHMHQPYYVNPLTKMAMMPWVRLHSVKGYLDMVDLLDRAPGVEMNFNFSPVLVRQIEELVKNKVSDLWESWSRKPVETLHPDERIRILENFFKINWDTLIKPYPRYYELLNRRGKTWSERSLRETVGLFSDADFRDLQTWFNLAWCGFSARKRYPLLDDLIEQERDFTEEQKNAVLDIHRVILSQVLALYRQAEQRGQIEITTTPYFHPIMPLVYDTELARRCMPHAKLPRRFSHPEDVAAQLRLAQEQHERVFGKKAAGLWPSEGSVAPEIIPLVQQAGFQYLCSDEGILFKSLEQDPGRRGGHIDHLEMFQGWRFWHEGAQIQALFRERPLSDFIGFKAAHNQPGEAADYLLHHLDHLSTVVTAPNGVALIALDGENAWETFSDGGEEFLTLFYRGLASRTNLRSRRLGSYFGEHPARAESSHLHTGSWINSDFDVWIGDPEENKAWEWIGQTRQFLVDKLADKKMPVAQSEAAWMEIYAAEGSDWFWWYGPDFVTDNDFLFDELFRTHLQNVYRILDATPPAYLDVPICLRMETLPYTQPHRYISPPRDGRLHNFYEWVGAGALNILQQQTAMFQADRIGRALFFGFDEKNFYLRLDATHRPRDVRVQFTSPRPCRLVVWHEGGGAWKATLEESPDQMQFIKIPVEVEVAWGQFLIITVPVRGLQWKGEGTVGFFVELLEKNLLKERYPERGAIEFPIPQADFEARQWYV